MAGQPLPIVDYLFDDRDRGESISEMNVALIHEEMVKGERVSVSWVPASQPWWMILRDNVYRYQGECRLKIRVPLLADEMWAL